MAVDTMYVSERVFKKNCEFTKSLVEEFADQTDLDLDDIDRVFRTAPRYYTESGSVYIKAEEVKESIAELCWVAKDGRVYKFSKDLVDWGMKVSFPSGEPTAHPDIDPAGGYGLESHI